MDAIPKGAVATWSWREKRGEAMGLKAVLVAAGVAVTAGAAVTAAGVTGAFASPHAAQPTAPAAPGPASTRVNGAAAAADAVSAEETRAGTGAYAGVSLTDNGNALVVHLTSMDPQTTARITALAARYGVTPTFVTAPATQAQLQDKLAEITAASGALRAQGITLESWGIAGSNGRIEVHVLRGTPAQDAEVSAQFGPLVTVTNVSDLPSTATLQAPAPRP